MEEKIEVFISECRHEVVCFDRGSEKLGVIPKEELFTKLNPEQINKINLLKDIDDSCVIYVARDLFNG